MGLRVVCVVVVTASEVMLELDWGRAVGLEEVPDIGRTGQRLL